MGSIGGNNVETINLYLEVGGAGITDDVANSAGEELASDLVISANIEKVGLAAEIDVFWLEGLAEAVNDELRLADLEQAGDLLWDGFDLIVGEISNRPGEERRIYGHHGGLENTA